MTENNDVNRREFIGPTAASGAAMVAGTNSMPEAFPDQSSRADALVYYVGYGSNLNVEMTTAEQLPNGRFVMKAYIPNYQVQSRATICRRHARGCKATRVEPRIRRENRRISPREHRGAGLNAARMAMEMFR